MRALRKVTAGPGLDLVDIPEPECGEKDVKIRVLRAGLCGTDLHLHAYDEWAAGAMQVPQTIGHEFYGEVVEVGADVEHVRVGDRVSGEGHVVCGVCRNCRAGRKHMCINTVGIGVNRDGAFADYVVIPASNAWVHGPDIEPDLGAIFDPLGNATHTALQWPVVGEDVVISGAGPIGCWRPRLCGTRGRAGSSCPTCRICGSRSPGRPAPMSSSTSGAARASPGPRSGSGCARGSTSGWRCRAPRPGWPR